MSEHYKALTRKYRPKSFEDIVSQEHVSSTLKNAISNGRLSHAYLFCGPRGVGKTTMARVLARSINEISDDIDGEELNKTLNIFEIDAASNNKVEDVHHLRERVRIPPQNGRYKVYIIDEVHMLSKSAFNALLKTLEEPPEHAIFIFATTEPHKILPTILSRCQRFDFRRIKVEEIISRLRFIADEEHISIDDESLHVIAKKADGALRDALGIFDQAIAFCGLDITSTALYKALNVVSSERMFEIMDLVANQNASETIQLLNSLLQEGYDIQEFLSSLTEHLRNLYLAKDSTNTYLIEATAELRQKYQDKAKVFSNDDLLRMMHIISEAQFKIRDTQQPKIQFEITMLKLIHMQRSAGYQALMAELKQVQAALQGKELPAMGKPSSPEPSAPPEKKITETYPETSQPSSQKVEEPNDVPSPKPAGSGTSSVVNKPEVPTEAVSKSQKTTFGGDLFGKPSLGNISNSVSGNITSLHGTQQVGQASISGNLALRTEKQSRPQALFQKGQKIYLHNIQNIWDNFLNLAKERLEQVLYFTIQRTTPVDFQDNTVTLECTDSFAYELIEERRTDYAVILQELAGISIRIRGKLKQQTQIDMEALDPYTRFKKLQEKDPKLRSIVEIFGAEIEL